MPARRGHRLLVGVVVAAGCLVILGVLVAGPVLVEAPRWLPTPAEATPIQPPGAEPGTRPEVAPTDPLVARVAAIVLGVLVVAALLAGATLLVMALARSLRRRRRMVLRRTVVDETGRGVLAAEVAAVPVSAVQRGIEQALRVLDQHGAGSDAVVQAWLGLEQSAADAGAGRAAAETPAEYTARIVARFDSDRDAAGRLLRLYQEVRFGRRAADEASVIEARESLLRLQRSWHDAEAPAR